MNVHARTIFSFLLILSIAGSGLSAATSNTLSANVEQQLRAIDAAKTAAKRNDATGTEQALYPAALSPVGSHHWHIEVSKLLLQVVHEVPREGASAVLGALVTSTLGHLNLAFSTAATARERSAAKALAGITYERFSGDLRLALASYKTAAELAPDNRPAREAADRLQRTLDNLDKRLAGKAAIP